MEMENMPTRQLFRRLIHSCSRSRPSFLFGRLPHLFPTNHTTSSTESINFRLRRVRVPFIHVSRRLAVSSQVDAFGSECAECEVQGNDVVDWDVSREDEDGVEEGGVDDEFNGVYPSRRAGQMSVSWETSTSLEAKLTISQIHPENSHTLSLPRRRIFPPSCKNKIDNVDRVFRCYRKRRRKEDRKLAWRKARGS
jgi:hypothetical protein